jgi:hypothetical protein
MQAVLFIRSTYSILDRFEVRLYQILASDEAKTFSEFRGGWFLLAWDGQNRAHDWRDTWMKLK